MCVGYEGTGAVKLSFKVDIIWAMGDSLPGVDSYSYYTPCFLPNGSIKVWPLQVFEPPRAGSVNV